MNTYKHIHFLSGEIKSLSDTVLDFRHPVLLDDILDKLPREDGLVHAYILPGNRGEKKLVARYSRTSVARTLMAR